MHGIGRLQRPENEQVQGSLQKIEARRLSHWCRSSTPTSNAAFVECQHQRLVGREIVQSALRDVFASGHFSPHPISHEELRAAFNPVMEWNVATIEPDRIQASYQYDGAPAGSRQINPDNLSLCAVPSSDPSKPLDVRGEYWRPRHKAREQVLKTRTHADPSCVSRKA